MTRCEVCQQDVLLRLYTDHMRQKHSENEIKEEESAGASEMQENKGIRGSRAAAQKYVKCQVHACVCLYVHCGVIVLNILQYNKIFFWSAVYAMSRSTGKRKVSGGWEYLLKSSV